MYFNMIIAVIKIFFRTQAVHLNYSDSPDPQPTTHPGRPCKLPYKLEHKQTSAAGSVGKTNGTAAALDMFHGASSRAAIVVEMRLFYARA